MLKKLKVYRGYVIDEHLKEFRKIHYYKNSKSVIEFVPFSSAKGRKLLFGFNNQIN